MLKLSYPTRLPFTEHAYQFIGQENTATKIENIRILQQYVRTHTYSVHIAILAMFIMENATV